MSEIKEGDRIEITFGRREGVQGTVLEKSKKRKGRYRIQLDGNGLRTGPVLEYPATKFTVVHRRHSRAPSTHDGAVFSKSDFDLMADTPSPGVPKSRYGNRAPSGFSEDNQLDTSSDEDHNDDDNKDFELLEQIIVARDSKGSLGIDVDRNLRIRRLNTQNALNSGLKVGQIIRKAHGVSVSSPKELVEVVSNSMSHVAVLLVTSIEEKKSPREPIKGYVPSPPSLSQTISPRTPSISRDENWKKKKGRKMSIRPRPPPRPPAKAPSTPDILSESHRAVSAETFEPVSNEPSAMMGGVSREPSTPLPFTRDSKIALLEARAKDLRKKYKIAKKNYYDDKSPENHDKAVSAKTAMLEAQKSLQDAMEVKNASEKKKTKKRREVSSPSSTSSSPIRVPERKDSRSNVKQNVRQERKQSDASLASQKSEERTIIKEGTLLKKTNKSLFRGWKEVRVKVDPEGVTYERVQSGLFGSSGRIHRVPYSDIKAVGSPEGADRDPKLGKMIEVIFYNENKKPWIFQAATLDDAMTWSAKIYYARRQSKNRRATQAQSDIAKSLANTMAVYVNMILSLSHSHSLSPQSTTQKQTTDTKH